MIPRDLLADLRLAAGADALEEHEAVCVDDVPLTATLRPADGEALARALAALGRAGRSVVVRGGGNRLALGNPPRGTELLLSTERLRGLDEFDPGEGVCRARAGTTLAEIRAEVGARGWELPLDPPGDGATLGGAIAAAAVGPQVSGFGSLRDSVLGLEVALANGERTRCGGRVVKNVTGYDLNKLYTGSLGTLGVIESAWLRLRPAPEQRLLLEVASMSRGDACRGGRAAARRTSTRVAAIVSAGAPTRDYRLVVELAGDRESVASDARWLGEELGASEVPAAVLEELRALQSLPPAEEGLRFRLAVRASRVEAAIERLADLAAVILAYPGPGLVFVGLALPEQGDAAAVDRAWSEVMGAAVSAGGHAVLESAPAAAKRNRDVFGDAPPNLELMRALKQRFDPCGVLNPGRFVGRL